VALFIKLWKQSLANGGRMAFCHLSAHLRQLVEVLCLDKVWPVFASEPEAFAYVSDSSHSADVGRCAPGVTRLHGSL
jgi:anti-anti-sigma regulatory factor